MVEEGARRRVVVEVCNARNLMPKDGQGTACAYAVVDFDGQRRRTATRPRDLNPQWGERLEFLVHTPGAMASETLELNVYNDKKAIAASGGGGGRKSGGTFLGKVKVAGASFAKQGDETLVYYPLEKRSVFSQIKGEIGLKVWFVDEPPPAPPAAPAADEKADNAPSDKKDAADDKGKDSAAAAAAPAAEEKKPDAAPPAEEKKPEEAAAKPEDKKPDNNGKKKSPEKGKKDGDKPKEEPKPKDDNKKEVAAAAAAPASPSKAPPPSPSKMQLATAGVAGDLEIRPQTAAERSMAASGGGSASYDLVDRVPYLFVRLLKAKHHHHQDGKRPLYAQLCIGAHTVRTASAGEWDQVFAFHKASLTASSLEVTVHEEARKPEKEGEATPEDANLGFVCFDLQEVPKRSPPDSALAPQWYTLEGHAAEDGAAACDVMLAVWVGTQVDEAFQEAWQSDSGGNLVHTRSKAYLSPKLWYLRLSVIQAQDLRLPAPPDGKAKQFGPAFPELYVKAQLGAQVFKTGRIALGSAAAGASNPSWNEDLLFVAAEPFDPFLTVAVEDVFSGHLVGQARVPLSSVHRRSDDRAEPPSRWLNLCGDEARPYAGRVHVRVCLEGGYHVLDEAANVASDVRAASKQLSKPPVGMLEVGIRGASNLVPMKIAKDGASGSTDAYVVLKYGPKWARTRTILDQFNPRWNEQYAWDVFDPCTVLSIAVFDNVRYKVADDGKLPKDARIGKLRIRLSTLDTNRVYVINYALTAVHPVGVRKMGELELAIRFTCPSWLTLMQAYGSPLLPRMHYVKPLGPAQQDVLRHTAMRIVSGRLARSEPPLGPEVVQYLLDTDTHAWSMRRSKANWFRVVGCLSHVATAVKWAHRVRTWEHSPTTVLVHMLLVAIVLCPEMILPTVCLYLFLVLLWRYRSRPREPTGMDPRLSHVDSVSPDELDEEFDGLPSGRPADVVRMRYDRLRAVAGRAQTLLGDVAAQGERIEALLSWRDPRATGVFAVVILLTALVLYAVPFKVLLLGMGFFYLRHPRFRGDMPSAGFNFFRRLPSLSDRVL
ncbi:multiple C2 domain and transmembrane region protein 14 [Lolium perenne]|uniref:multiple C2 domain and transmembrane region protein 14 n=1 Tax=Lolium perenne TaxID=4522 RepID=UPI0021EA646C|nr:FT-interacting protein 3 [Lolium perenne]